MKVIQGNIIDVKEGAICHQVNCRGAFGAGVSGVIGGAYPVVEDAYLSLRPTPALLGTFQRVQVAPGLYVYNVFGQVDYGNAARTGRVYTDMRALTTALKDICCAHKLVYVPYNIGCGLAGGNWDEFVSIMDGVSNLVAVRYGT